MFYRTPLLASTFLLTPPKKIKKIRKLGAARARARARGGRAAPRGRQPPIPRFARKTCVNGVQSDGPPVPREATGGGRRGAAPRSGRRGATPRHRHPRHRHPRRRRRRRIFFFGSLFLFLFFFLFSFSAPSRPVSMHNTCNFNDVAPRLQVGSAIQSDGHRCVQMRLGRNNGTTTHDCELEAPTQENQS